MISCFVCLCALLVGYVIQLIIDYKESGGRQLCFMGREFTEILKGIAIIFVFLNHVGNVNNVRFVAPLGGIGVALFLICSGYGLNDSAKKGFSSRKYWFKRLLAFFAPYMITRIIALLFTTDISVKRVLLDITCLKARYAYG